MLTLALGAALAAQAAPPVRSATADECAVIVAIGRGRLDWTAERPPREHFFPEYDEPGGGTYRQDCAWASLGVAAPRIGDQRSTATFYITRPRFRRGGRVAVAEFTTTLSGGPHPFISTERCTVRRRKATWTFAGCEQILVT